MGRSDIRSVTVFIMEKLVYKARLCPPVVIMETYMFQHQKSYFFEIFQCCWHLNLKLNSQRCFQIIKQKLGSGYMSWVLTY